MNTPRPWGALAITALLLGASSLAGAQPEERLLVSQRTESTRSEDDAYAARIGRTLGLELLEVKRTSFLLDGNPGDDAVGLIGAPPVHQPGLVRHAEGRALSVVFDGLQIERVLLGARYALWLAAYTEKAIAQEGEVRVVEVRGPWVTLLSGPALSDPALAARALTAARGPTSAAADLVGVSFGLRGQALSSRAAEPIRGAANDALEAMRRHEDAARRHGLDAAARSNPPIEWIRRDQTHGRGRLRSGFAFDVRVDPSRIEFAFGATPDGLASAAAYLTALEGQAPETAASETDAPEASAPGAAERLGGLLEEPR